jgi:hypothetical protein
VVLMQVRNFPVHSAEVKVKLVIALKHRSLGHAEKRAFPNVVADPRVLNSCHLVVSGFSCIELAGGKV